MLTMIPSILALTLASTGANAAPGPFSYARHRTPRAAVLHSPLNPASGETVRLRAEYELPPGAVVSSVEFTLTVPGGAVTTVRCPSPQPAKCETTAPGMTGPGYAVYSATVIWTTGRITTPRYRFQIGRFPGSTRVLLREPAASAPRPFPIVLTRHAPSYPTDADALKALLRALYREILSDPAYRWRDDQLSFVYTTVPGETEDYYSRSPKRCGQQPWPPGSEPPEARAARVTGVVHRLRVRDCASMLSGAKGRFSASLDVPLTFQHEFGHAFAGLSDEYVEDESTRRVPGSPGNPNLPQCRCCDPSPGGTVTNPLTGERVTTPPVICPPGTRRCSTPTPPECLPTPDICPSLFGPCASPNLFHSKTQCAAMAGAIAGPPRHAGVEAPTSAKRCRQLCGAGMRPCPCTKGDAWILDDPYPQGPPGGELDVMGLTGRYPNGHGAACERCLETTFCVAWEVQRLLSPAAARRACGLTP